MNLYCSELWGLENEFQDANPFEYLHMKFIKESLGVHCKDSKEACSAELARLPLESKVLVAAINFWQHNTSQNTLVNKIYSVTEITSIWVKKVKSR